MKIVCSQWRMSSSIIAVSTCYCYSWTRHRLDTSSSLTRWIFLSTYQTLIRTYSIPFMLSVAYSLSSIITVYRRIVSVCHSFTVHFIWSDQLQLVWCWRTWRKLSSIIYEYSEHARNAGYRVLCFAAGYEASYRGLPPRRKLALSPLM